MKNKRNGFKGKGGDHFAARVLTSEVASEHEVEDEKTVLVVLEGIAQVDDERVIDLNVTVRDVSESWGQVTAVQAGEF